MTEIIDRTDRTKVRRLPKRGVYERETVYRILDEAFVCYVGFVSGGQPFVIPTGCARIGDELVIHGSAASRLPTRLSDEIEVPDYAADYRRD